MSTVHPMEAVVVAVFACGYGYAIAALASWLGG
jgi:hypothetical protein